MKTHTMTYIGIWLDRNEAHVITLENGQQKIRTISAEVEHYHVRGGARSKLPYGPMDKVSEKKYLFRKQQQLKNYFQRLAELASAAENLYIFGPANTKYEYHKFLKAANGFQNMEITIATAEKMTRNQMAAQVRNHFGIPDHWQLT